MLTALQIRLALYGILLAGIVSGALYIKHVFNERDKFEAESKYERAEKDKAIKTLTDERLDAGRNQKIVYVTQQGEEKIKYVDRIVTKKIIEYRDAEPVRCQLPASWVSIYNESLARIDLQDPSAKPNEASK